MKIKRIIEASQLPEGEKVYLVQDKIFGGWRVIEPPTKWYHYVFGGKKNIITLISLAIILGLLYLGFNEAIANYKAIADEPCKFCQSCFNQINETLIINQFK